LLSFEKFYKELSAKMSDENLVKNPQDLQKAMAETYTNNLDSVSMYGKAFLRANPYRKIEQTIKNPTTGALMLIQGELPEGWTIDALGNKVPPPPKTMVVDGKTITMDYADQELARLQSTNPDMLALMKKQAGIAGQNMSEKDLVKFYIDRVPMTAKAVESKSANQLRAEELKVKELEFNVANQGKEFDLKRRLTEAQITAAGKKGQGGEGFNPQSLSDLSINVNEQGKSATFGGDGIKIDVPAGAGSRQTVPFKATSIRTLANGKKEIIGYKLDYEGKVTGELSYIPFDNNKIIQGSLNSSIQRMDKNDKQYFQTQLAVFDRVGIPQRASAVGGSMTDADILATKPAGTKGTDAQYIAAFKALNKIK
jgi:hypothetical protein